MLSEWYLWKKWCRQPGIIILYTYNPNNSSYYTHYPKENPHLCVPLPDSADEDFLILPIAILVNNAFKTVQQSAKDKEEICRRADARQRYLTQDFTLWWAGLRCIILEDCYISILPDKDRKSYVFSTIWKKMLILD